MKPTKAMQNFVIKEVAGEDVLDLVSYLEGKQNVSEFVIAQDMELEINNIRNMLYRLLDKNLVSFNRKKDKQKGWYIYYWTFNPLDVNHIFWDIKKKRLEALQNRLHREKSNVFFISPTSGIRLEFDKAVEFDFRCPETGDILVQEDNSQKISQIQQEIDDLEKDIAEKKKAVVAKPAPTKKTTKKAMKKATKKTTKKATKKTVKKTSKKKTTKKK